MPRLLIALILLLLPVAAQAQVAPDARWRTLETEHFRVTFGPGLEELARHAGDRAEVAHARLSAELASAPRGKIDIVLTDDVDFSNGMATPFPSNRITLYARPPVDNLSLSFHEDWLDLVVVHELTHIFHMDQTGRLGRAVRSVFGRLPLFWPVFPVIGSPDWALEGLATFTESHQTGAGRVHGSYHDMVLRTAVLEGAFESIDQVSGDSPVWPAGARSYIYGSMFADYLARKYGPEVHRELVKKTAGAWIPPFLAFDRIAKKAIGRSFTREFGAWREELEARYARLADSLRAEGITTPERLTAVGYHAYFPRVARDGRVAYAASDGRSAAATRVLDPGTGESHALSRRNGLGPASWLPDGALLTSQLEFRGPYRIYGDLYRVDGHGEHRLTRGARLGEPDVAPDGRSVIAVQGDSGSNRLVRYDLAGGGLRPLTGARRGVSWAFPRWAPDGERIAVGRWQDGAYDVVVLDTTGAVLHEVTGDRAVDMAPAWSPDGRYIVFSSDRSGIPNLYAYEPGPRAASAGGASAPVLHQVTSLLTGAFYPDVSPDGRWIYFAGYHADGFHIERVPFDPAAWRAPAPLRPELAAAAEDEAPAAKAGPAPSAGGEGAAAAEIRPYSPLRSLLPRFWLPVVETIAARDTFYGATISGQDLVGRHAYSASLAVERRQALFEGHLAYSYGGLGNPVLNLGLSRSWDGEARRLENAPAARLLSREDALSLSATLLRRRWRSSAALTLGGERSTEELRLLDAPGYRLRDPKGHLVGAFARAAFANYQLHPFSISPEDGVSLSLGARRRRDLDVYRSGDTLTVDRSYDEATARATAYKGFPVFGFADHVLAARLSAGWRGGPGAGTFGVGGASGSTMDLVLDQIGGSYFFPVRGFHGDARAGTRAWSASLEYRLPLALVNRGVRLWPLFLDRLSASAFLDAGGAWCATAEQASSFGCAAAGDAADATLVSAGAELSLDASLFFIGPLRFRGGVARALRGTEPGARPVLYFQFGPSF